ncbi:helix-turn-helix domain-containing protein [Saccharopolyspora sp. MS10]|uniref:helix-turn-helix domain-containing protein n=1 Tax=Saccharopolyspora sp. MS10 TaxID=3385973 RepID=UPI0039A05EB0
MAKDPGPLVQRLVLGAELRDLREAAGLTSDDVASHLGWYRSKVSKIETGEGKLSDKDIEVLLTLYGAHERAGDKVHRLAVEARRKLPAARVTDWAKKYVSLEESASEIKMFFPDVIPGLLHTSAYAHECLSASVMVPSVEVDEIASARERRSGKLFDSDPPQVWAVMGEEAIQRRVGNPEIHRGQLEHIRQLADLDNVTIQLIPTSMGTHPGMGLMFTLLHIDAADATIAYIENLTSADYFSGSQHVRAYSLVFDRLRVAALSDRESLRLIDRQIRELGEE